MDISFPMRFRSPFNLTTHTNTLTHAPSFDFTIWQWPNPSSLLRKVVCHLRLPAKTFKCAPLALRQALQLDSQVSHGPQEEKEDQRGAGRGAAAGGGGCTLG
jgi:hypothetical protein